ncbi:MAG: hypothetical protein H7328_12735 [Bdellovibrio sp.]|nr:hypothetical protein [Bdellovibrio sp.]
MNKVLATGAFLLLTAFTSPAFSWGGRGHAAICESAVFLVKNKQLKEYLQNKPQTMAYLCNIPDTYWRSLAPELRKLGDPGHFINAESLGLKIKDVPTDFKSIVSTYTGQASKVKENATIYSVPDELGSNWWRADQFYRRAIADGAAMKDLAAPKNSKEEQNDDLPYNKNFFQMMVNLGLMGHFIGDASQPFHNTSDYDGYAAGHGGIHAYYEDSAVAFFDADLVAKVTKKARAMKTPSFVKQKTFIENMRVFSDIAAEDIKEVLKLDPVTKPSSLKIDKGMSLRTPAERKDASVGLQKFEKLILTQMARSSYLLAYYWDEAYKAAGEPPIKAYKSYRFPHSPEFVAPDYFDTKSAAIVK